MKKKSFSLFLLAIPFSIYCQKVDSEKLPDLTGSWQGTFEVANGARKTEIYVETYLTKLNVGEYSGISYTAARFKGDNTPFKNANLPAISELFLARFDGSTLTITELDTLTSGSSKSLNITSSPSLQFNNNNGTFEIIGITNKFGSTGYTKSSYYIKRISETVPMEYAKLQISESTFILDSVKFLDRSQVNVPYNLKTGDDKTGFISYTVKNTSAIDFKNLEIDLVAFEKGADGKERANILKYTMMQNINVNKKSTFKSAIAIGSGFPHNRDSVHFRMRIACGDFTINTNDLRMSTKLFKQIDADQDKEDRMVGSWQINHSKSLGIENSFFSNELIEFHKGGITISRNKEGNSTKNVKIFTWEIKDDSFSLTEPRIVQIYYSLNWINDNEIKLSAHVNGRSIEASLIKIDANPLKYYDEFLDKSSEGNWTGNLILENGYAWVSPRYYYDIHTSNDAYGELVGYNSDKLDSLGFIKYSSVFNFVKAAKLNPILGAFEHRSSIDTNAHYYSFDFMNTDWHIDAKCLISDGILIITQAWGKRIITIYLIKQGLWHWPHMYELHDQYNAYRIERNQTPLPPFGTHWATCKLCRGQRQIVTGEYYVDVYSPQEHHDVRERRETISRCTKCNGAGGYYVDDNTGERVR